MAIGIQICECRLHTDHRTCDPSLACHDFKGPAQVNNVTGSYIEGRDLSKFDQDILKILCAVLMKTGPVHISGQDIAELDVYQLVVEPVHDADKYIVSYGEVN